MRCQLIYIEIFAGAESIFFCLESVRKWLGRFNQLRMDIDGGRTHTVVLTSLLRVSDDLVYQL